MKIDRRAVLAGGVAAGAGLALGAPAARAQGPKNKGVLKISSQEWIIPGRDLAEKIAKMEKWGFDGIEFGGDVVGKEKTYTDAVRNSKLKISAICLGSLNGGIVSEDVARRKPAEEELKRVIESAGAVGSTGVIYVPAFNGQTKLTNPEIRKILLDRLPELGDFAAKAGTRLLLEPLNRGEAYFLRQVADGASICRDCKSPGVCVMGDFYHMYIEETSDLGAFISGGKYLHHVHLACIKRTLPGQDGRDFTNGFAGLKYIGYQDFCSLECGVDGDREVEIPKSVQFLRDQWAKARL
jgi:sugar phosphate isomerase/epimerase